MKILDTVLHILHLTEEKVDFISELPPEMSRLILQKLDPESLLRAAQVSRSWMNICQSDPCLKDTARRYKNAKKLELEKEKEISNFIDSAGLDCLNHTDNKIKELNDYYKSCDYTQCAQVYKTIRLVDKYSHRNCLNYIDECPNLWYHL